MADKIEFKAQNGKQQDFLSTDADIAIFGGARGGGKAIYVETPIPTPSGWSKMGDLKVGDQVFSESGNPTEIIWTSEIMNNRSCYEVEFDDGSKIIADEGHLWKTFKRVDLISLVRRTDEYRRKRRLKRKSKISGKKTERFTKAIVERNRRMMHKILPPPEGSISTTLQICKTLKSGTPIQCNHAVRNHSGILLPETYLPIDPYVLGVWLGDGTSVRADITCADHEILENLRNLGWKVTKNSQGKYGYTLGEVEERERRNGQGIGRVNSFGRFLDDLNLRSNKHVPEIYLRASRDQRLHLLQGLMDTDGYADEKGGIEFTSTNINLAKSVKELINSLGYKASISVGRAMLYGKDCGEKYRIHFRCADPVFRLSRKLNRQKRNGFRTTQGFRYITSCKKVKSVPVKCIQVSDTSGMFLAGESMIPTHNSYGLLLEALRNTGNPDFRAIIFRRTFPQIEQEGGLWDTSQQIYPYTGAAGSKGNMRWIFPSGATVSFAHMMNEDDRYAWLGAQIPLICFDELVTFTEKQFFFMLGSNRSMCGVRPYIRATTNPDSKSWVAKFIEWWIDQETGYPIEERSGKIRYFVRYKDVIMWADTAEELQEQYPGMIAKSVTFIPSKVYDNKILLERDPAYLSNLMALGLVDRERYLHGNWKIDSSGGIMFKREWFRIVNNAPGGITNLVRYWDTAATEPGKKNKDPDWTAGVLMGLYNGQWIVLDLQHFRGSAKTVEDRIKQCAQTDPHGTRIRMEQEPGASGVMIVDHYARHVLVGYDFKGIPSVKNKPTRARPLSSAAEQGNVILVHNPLWNGKFLDEMENFKGLDEKNDIVDAATGAMNELQNSSGEWKFAIPQGTGRYSPLVPIRVGSYRPIGN